MTSKERFLKALRFERPDRVPYNIWMDRRMMQSYADQYGDSYFRVTQWGADVIETFAVLPFPRGETHEETGTDWQLEPYLRDWADADALVLPDPESDVVYELIAEDLRRFPDTAVILDIPTCWGVISNIRTFESMFTDMVDHPEPLKRLSQRITDIQVRVAERACEMGITALYLMEDLASAMGPLMSPRFMHAFCLDYAAQVAEVGHKHNVPVLFHCCGRALDLMDEIVSIGVDAVNPLQPHLNDLDAFLDKYGGRVAIYGGLDNTYKIPAGTRHEVREHIVDVFHRAGRDGGLVLSTHDIPIETPLCNIETVIDTIVGECRYDGETQAPETARPGASSC